jgi:hypothetical protein
MITRNTLCNWVKRGLMKLNLIWTVDIFRLIKKILNYERKSKNGNNEKDILLFNKKKTAKDGLFM